MVIDWEMDMNLMSIEDAAKGFLLMIWFSSTNVMAMSGNKIAINLFKIGLENLMLYNLFTSLLNLPFMANEKMIECTLQFCMKRWTKN